MELTDLIGNYGFPIAMCAYLTYDRLVLMKEFRKSIDGNTATTQRLVSLLEKP